MRNNRYKLCKQVLLISLFTFLLVGSFQLSFGQADWENVIYDDMRTLFTIDGQDVPVAEFEYVYNKNNISGDADYSKESLEEYLDLFIRYRLKVAEANRLQFDTIPSLMSELEMYKGQLAQSYLNDKEILNELIDEAYQRLGEDVDISLLVVKYAPAGDTTEAREKINTLYSKANRGSDLSKLAETYNDEEINDVVYTDFGWITAFQAFYELENAIYDTEVGKVSKPIRYVNAYYIVKVNDRRESSGEVQVAHIFKAFPKGADAEKRYDMKAEAQEIYDMVMENPEDFNAIAQQHSDDPKTKNSGGVLGWMATGAMEDAFMETAFALEVGGISEPIQTEVGWHVLKKLDARTLPEFEEIRGDLKRRIERDPRSKVAEEVLVAKSKEANNYMLKEGAMESFIAKLDTNFVKGRWQPENKDVFDGVLFELAGEAWGTEADFVDHLSRKHAKRIDASLVDATVEQHFKSFVHAKVMEYEQSLLSSRYQDFDYLMREYRDGILIFDLTDKRVWKKAIEDTTGLQAFHETVKENYMWDERVLVEIFNCTDAKIASKARKLSAKGKTPEEIRDKCNKAKKPESRVSIISGKFAKGQYDLIDKIDWQAGMTDDMVNEDGTVTFVHIKELVPPEPKLLGEAKGYIVSDYQTYLEKEWLAELENRYEVVMNQEVFDSLIQTP